MTDERRLALPMCAAAWVAVLVISPPWLAWATLAAGTFAAGGWIVHRFRPSVRLVLRGLAAACAMWVLVFAAEARTSTHVDESRSQMKALIVAGFGAGALGREMVCIADRESHLEADAINWNDHHSNGPGSFGLFQIGRVHVHYVGGNWRRLLNPRVNVRVAKQLYLAGRRAGQSGLGPWGGGC